MESEVIIEFLKVRQQRIIAEGLAAAREEGREEGRQEERVACASLARRMIGARPREISAAILARGSK